jgi:hypothetical protein
MTISDFVQRTAYDLLLRSQAAAKFNLRDVIEFWDLPIAKGLQERTQKNTMRVQAAMNSARKPALRTI